MATQLFWGEPNGAFLWDLCILGGEALPGIATVGTTVARKLDIKEVKGQDGGELDDQGYKNAPVTITLQLWEEWQWEEWQRIVPGFHPRNKGGSRDPLEIFHPEPNSKGVTQVYLSEIAPIRIENGIGTITLKCVEWFSKTKTKKAGNNSARSSARKAMEAEEQAYLEAEEFAEAMAEENATKLTGF